MRWLLLMALVPCCKRQATIAAEDAVTPVVDAGAMLAVDAPSDAPMDVVDPDACVPGDVWDVKIEQKNRWRPEYKIALPGALEVVVPRMGVRKAIYPDCGMTGGGCGDCTKPYDRARISCKLEPNRVTIDIGIDDVGPTWVVVEQRGNLIMADWSEDGHKRSEVAVMLPCAVKVRFVR